MSVGIIALTTPGSADPSVAIGASRAGAVGVLDLEFARDVDTALAALATLRRLGRSALGVRLGDADRGLTHAILGRLGPPLTTLIVTVPALRKLRPELDAIRARGMKLLVEVVDAEGATLAEEAQADEIIARGLEAGGWGGDETTFVLLQRLLGSTRLPVWAHGGIGLHSAAGAIASGAAGVVLDLQLALTREAALPTPARAALERMDGSETIRIGEALGRPFRAFSRPGLHALDELRRLADTLEADVRPLDQRAAAWETAVRQRVGWADGQLWPVGQDAAFAAALARRFVTVGGVVAGLRQAVHGHLHAAARVRPLAEGSPLAVSHGTRYPILQGPMTRVSDTPAFVASVAAGGALPFLALALMRGPEVRKLLEETSRRLTDQPWGVGILGFVPLELRQEQLDVIRVIRPPFALIAGGRPDQALSLEQVGIPTYLHVPSPALLRMFLDAGARRFVFEGRECGGHVGPRSSFVLWDTMVETLLGALSSPEVAQACHVVFAGGIHDATSSAMVAALAAPLTERGVKVGALLGTAYVFTEEAVRDGAITATFQEEAIACSRTVLLESGLGHATRCVDTPFAETFRRERQRLQAEGRTAEEVRDALEELNLGRLRIASKGVARNPRGEQNGGRLVAVSENEQRREGMYMIGQVAALRDRVCTIAELHRDVSEGGSARLAALQPIWEVTEQPPACPPCDIAIIGMACIMPKAPNLETFWTNILNKVDAITEIPLDRFDWRRYFDPDPRVRDKIYSKWGGFIDPVPFDPARYGMPPNSLPSIEPLQLLTLEVVRAALEDAGYATRSFPRERTGVIAGVGGGIADLGQKYMVRSGLPMVVKDVPATVWDGLPEWTEDSFAGIILNVVAGRVANRFDLGGVNYAVDAACASSLAALYCAARELEAGMADTMIVVAAETVQNPFAYLAFSKTRALSPRGRCRTFDERADGIVISEGIAVAVVKRLADAERDGDRIYAVLKGVAGSSDGRDRSMTAPRPEGQVLALERAYRAAGFAPSTVELIEAHGTGTVAGDEAEIQSLTRVFGHAGARRQWCAVGSVKSMIGHTKCAAGLAGLIKVTKALYHKVLPPTIGVDQPNPKARFSEGPFYVNTEPRPWLREGDHPRRAGVSSFGFGGTNFHAVLEEYAAAVPALAATAPLQTWPAELFLLVERGRGEILAAANALADLAAPGAQSLRHLAAAAWEAVRAKREALGAEALTLAIVAMSAQDLREKLTAARSGLADNAASIDDRRGVYFAEAPLARGGQIAFLFPGQGSQYPDMLRDLAVVFEEVRSCFESATRTLAGRYPQPLGAYVFPPPRFSPDEERACEEALKQTHVAQPSLGAADLGMFRLLTALGVRADATAGHSYGEYVALCAAGSLAEEALYALSETRGRVIVECAGAEPGTMAAVQAGRNEVAAALDGTPGVWIANVNGPKQTVISGTRAGIEAAVPRLAAAGLQASPVPVACAFHSPVIAGAGERFAEHLRTVRFAAPRIPVFSNTHASRYDGDPAGIPSVLSEHIVRPVLFMDELRAMYDAGCRIFVEVGPRNVLTSLAQQTFRDQRVLAVSTDVPGRPGIMQLLHALGQLAAQGVAVSLDRLFARRPVATPAESPSQPSPTTWLVSGGRARPLTAPTAAGADGRHRAGDDSGSQAAAPPPVSPAAASAPSKQPETPRVPAAASPETAAGAVIAPATASAVPVPVASAVSRDAALEPTQADEVMVQFQRTMSRFLETQRNVMLAYLGVAADPSAGMREEATVGEIGYARLEQPADDRRRHPRIRAAWPVRVVDHSGSEKVVTAADVSPLGVKLRLRTEMPEGTMVRLEFTPPDGLPSLTLVSLLVRSDADGQAFYFVNLTTQELQRLTRFTSSGPAPALTEAARVPGAQSSGASQVVPALLAVAAPASAVSASPQIDANRLQQELLRIVGDRTGYPEEMLGLDLNLEADLGIDSIKRVEILGAFQRAFRPEDQALLQAAMGDLVGAKTLRAVLEGAGRILGAPRAHVPRFLMLPVDAPPISPAAPSVERRTILITDDGSGIGQRLADQLGQLGGRALLVRPSSALQTDSGCVYGAPLDDPSGVAALLAQIHKDHGRLSGIIHLLPLHSVSPFDLSDFPAWRNRLHLEAKSLFYLLRAAAGDLKNAVEEKGPAWVLAVSSMGGAFAGDGGAQPFFPGQGSLAGLIKSLSLEWPAVRCKVLDVEADAAIGETASHVLREMASPDNLNEVGYQGSRRLVLQPIAAGTDRNGSGVTIDADSVILITGGARGITAEVAGELARQFQPRLVIVGRSPFPPEEEATDTAGQTEPQDIKKALISRLKQAGEDPTVAQVEAAYRQLMNEREIRRNLARFRQLGARVEYRQADVRDESALRAVVAEIYAAHDRLDGVIHGAGLIEDKLIEDKTPDSLDRVFDTKADSVFLLSRLLRSNSLRFLVLFSSVAGRFGNRGQADYGAANEVLNKFAVYLDRCWPGRVVSIIWGPWGRIGMASPEVQEQFVRRGIQVIPPEEGSRLLVEEILHGRKGEVEVVFGNGPWVPDQANRPIAVVPAGRGLTATSDGRAGEASGRAGTPR